MSYRATLFSHLFELAVSAVFAVIGVSYLIDPQQTVLLSPVGRYVGHWQYMWALFYLASCPLIWNGIFLKHRGQRVAGLTLLASGATVQGIAAVTFRLDVRDAIYFMYAMVATLRIWYLLYICPREK